MSSDEEDSLDDIINTLKDVTASPDQIKMVKSQDSETVTSSITKDMMHLQASDRIRSSFLHSKKLRARSSRIRITHGLGCSGGELKQNDSLYYTFYPDLRVR